MINKILNRVTRTANVQINKSKFFKFLDEVPASYKNVMEFSYLRSFSQEDKDLGAKIESFRDEISNSGDESIHTYGSPHSNSDLFNEEGKVQPGIYKASKASGVAKTGTPIFGGVQLKMLVEAFGSARILELGTNTGLSGSYFLSARDTEQLVTVEGSADLCKIAERNLSRISDKFVLKNMLFQDAIDELAAAGEKFDIAFIDGQHEKQATIYYTDLIMPLMKEGGMFIYDDIYWSEDMNAAWCELMERDTFETSIDFGNRGICIIGDGKNNKKHYNLCEYIGEPSIYRSGW